MFKEILGYLPYLGAAIITNILLGLYNSLEKIKENFSWKKLLSGLLKAAIISEAFLALALIFDRLGDAIDMGIFEAAPDVLLLGVIALYVGKCIENLKNIFGATSEDIAKVKEYMPEYIAPPDSVNHELEDENADG